MDGTHTRRAPGSERPAWAAALIAAALVAGAWPGAATAATPATPPVLDRPVHPDSGLGEPEIAINPLNPADIVVGENDTGVSVSHDGGAGWTRVALPNPGDNALAVEPDGTFAYTALDGDVRVSRDGGSSWQTAGNWVGAVAAQAHAAAPTGVTAFPGRELGCNAPEPEGPVSADPADGPGPQLIGCDRPWLQADPATGTLYVSFTDHDDASGGEGAHGWELALLACRPTVLTNPAFECGRQYVSASRDGGRTWSRFQPFDSADHPAGATGGFSSGPVASGGYLATAYLASQTPAGKPCPCVVFERSRDAGATWSRHVVPVALPPAAILSLEQSTLFEPYVAADPSDAERYAVMVLDAAQTHLLVFTTGDGGASWSGPAVLAEPGGKRYLPWIAYGPTGALGAVWRSAAVDGSYAVWAAVAPRGDTHFAPAVRLSGAPSPGPVSQLAGDDASDVALDERDLHAVWGDRRGGQLGVWYGRYRWAADPAVQALMRATR